VKQPDDESDGFQNEGGGTEKEKHDDQSERKGGGKLSAWLAFVAAIAGTIVLL